MINLQKKKHTEHTKETETEAYFSFTPPMIIMASKFIRITTVIAIVLGSFLTSASGEEAIITDPYANISTPLREIMRNRHSGVTINVHLLAFQSRFMREKFKNYELLTGATIKEVVSTQAAWYDDVIDDIKNRDIGFIDLYATFGNWIPQFAEMGGLKDISEEMLNTVGEDWFDIMPAVRSGVATYKQKVYAVPLDGDVIVMLYRKDLVEDVGLPTPRSWQDVLDILEYYQGKDIDGDGVADFGNCFPTAQRDIADKMFWAVASSFLQTLGTSQGTFFHPITMEPTSSTPGFIEVLEVYDKLVQHSPFHVNNTGVDWASSMDYFNQGRCVLWYNTLGPTKTIISEQAANGMAGVLNLAPLPGMKCTEYSGCPHASSHGVNHAPFLAGGGLAYAVNARVSQEKQRAALDFALYLSDPEASFWDVAHPHSYLDPLRQRHTTSLANNETKEAQAFLEFGWENRQLAQLKSVTEFNFLHENYVLDLRLLGSMDYQGNGMVPHLLKMWEGKATAQETADAITMSWNSITEQYGLAEQRKLYRNVLGLPEYIDPEGKSSTDILKMLIAVTIPVGLIALLLLLVVAKQRHTIKFKTRDVDDAPKTGTIALIFTDIEGSTSLWDGCKNAMQKSLEIHHNVIRKCIQRHRAYEVKTIGDSFMIAVVSADKAVMLANDIQLDLLNADWPLEIAEMPSACVEYFRLKPHSIEPPKPMFKGLRVRIGVHLGQHSKNVEEGGQIQILHDKIAKGYDYYGPVVNTAARIEDIGFGGQTIISSAVHQALSEPVQKTCSVSPIGKKKLNGVLEELFLFQCLPLQLKGRRFHGFCRKRDSTASTKSAGGSGLEYEECLDKIVDVMTLTPADLQQALQRMQQRVLFLENKLSIFEDGGIQTEGCRYPEFVGVESDDDLSFDDDQEGQKEIRQRLCL